MFDLARLDAGETPEEGARRELVEEAGLAGDVFDPTLVKVAWKY